MSDDEYDYTGVHAFVFIDSVDPGENIRDVIDRLQIVRSASGRTRVMFASEMVGSYLGFAHVRTETLAELQDLIAGELWSRGARLCALRGSGGGPGRHQAQGRQAQHP